jgi:hypothetical protein
MPLNSVRGRSLTTPQRGHKFGVCNGLLITNLSFRPNGLFNIPRIQLPLPLSLYLRYIVVITALSIPEIVILPSDIPSDAPDRSLYTWKMKVYEESIFDSYDHGDHFGSVEEALAHAYSVFHNLVNHRHLFPSNKEQEFKITITQKPASSGNRHLALV